MDDSTARQRERMVAEQIAARGIDDAAVLAAMREVPREQFVDAAWHAEAYDDTPLPIGDGQTISQPYIVALMLAALRFRPGDRVLEIGVGSGYASALASRIVAHVDAVERHPRLADLARARLAHLGYDNVTVHCADGSAGWPAGAPYDAIMVAAAGPRIPAQLRDQLGRGGRLVMPVDDDAGSAFAAQRLVQLTRDDDGGFRARDLGGVMFVPLVGVQGWPEGCGR
jgi:protein-L-isoaspartate(D-aspartate) O-methyltransferase